jgi:glycosyltransferase involved in cell wall biosynthesis
VIAVSEATARALVAAYGVPGAKIHVIHHGVSRRFAPTTAEEIRRIRIRYDLPDRYVLTVGTIQPRKNLPALVEAMGVVAAARLPHRLVVVGKSGWLSDIVEQQMESADQLHLVHRLGYVPSNDLPALYAGADVFTLPSLYEGFGLPVLEAMACGVPVLVSNRAALPEIAGNAALVVDPNHPTAIGRGLVQLIADEDVRSTRVAAGLKRAARFTWERAAAQTLAVLRDAASRGNR